MNHQPLRFWHVTPLHYVLYLLLSGGLLSQTRLRDAGLPIRPRRTASRRDRKLKLDGFVHLSFQPQTPLLADKQMRGYRHVLLEFGEAAADLPGAAFLPFNTKAWRHRDEFVPITGPEAKSAFLAAWRSGRYPSAELLVPGVLPLRPHALALHAASDEEAEWLRATCLAVVLAPMLPICASPELFPPGPAPDLAGHRAYGDACTLAGKVLPPPDLPFD